MIETDLEHQSERRAYWRARAENAEAENERLRAALTEYGYHRVTCARWPKASTAACTCGFASVSPDSALAARDGDATKVSPQSTQQEGTSA